MYELINPVSNSKVRAIARSIRKNGWQGMPVLTLDNTLITGSHRVAAVELLNQIENKHYQSNTRLETLDVTNILSGYCEDNGMTIGELDIEYDHLGQYFEGTEIEQYKDELIEW